MRHFKHLHIDELMYIPMTLVVLLYLVVYGGAAWVLFVALRYLVRHVKKH